MAAMQGSHALGGKVRENWNFAKVREMSGNFDECRGKFEKNRQMSGNFETLSGKFALGCVNSVFKG